MDCGSCVIFAGIGRSHMSNAIVVSDEGTKVGKDKITTVRRPKGTEYKVEYSYGGGTFPFRL